MFWYLTHKNPQKPSQWLCWVLDCGGFFVVVLSISQKEVACSRKPLHALAVCHSEAFPAFGVDYGAHRDHYTEGNSKINPTIIFPPGWHSFSPSFHYKLHFVSILCQHKVRAGSQAAQQLQNSVLDSFSGFPTGFAVWFGESSSLPPLIHFPRVIENINHHCKLHWSLEMKSAFY